ncbi:MAG: M28 family peptidase [Melioribacter sp.]|uniref:M28 family peptidase n=1 Tax=Rosettibacter primus TaxID=3111523 RepID=UPI00247E8AC2|nr:M28 family peptidase [Melioribacter sp.]
MRKYLIIFLSLITTITYSQKKWIDSEITPKDLKAHLFYLASDEMKGRFTGSNEERKVGNYIKEQFAAYGLKPLFNNSYFQEFPFIEKIELTRNNSVLIKTPLYSKKLIIKKDFITAPFSGNGNAKSNVIFAGYGISAPELNYDDYEKINVYGKIVIVLRSNPENDSARSEFEKYSSMRFKALIAKEKGAAAIIFVNQKKNDDELIQLTYDGAPGIKNFPVVQVKREFIENIFEQKGLILSEIQKQIDSQKKPHSIEFDDITISIATEVKEIEKKARNVAGYLEGNSPNLKNEYLVIGAHYDHLGIDQLLSSSLYKGKDKQIHNGADDNASGTSGLLELAEKFSSIKDSIRRSIIFIAFSGEELGILGSTYFTNNLPIPQENIIAMLNLDMVGRLDSEKNLTIIGAGTSSKWKDMLNKNNKYNFELNLSDAGSGGSDHQAFLNKNIPVLFFFTGIHSDYHRPSDDADKINYDGASDVIKFVFDIANEIQNYDAKIDFVKVSETVKRTSTRSRVTVGTIPEFGYNGEGYKISGVTEGGPAEKAGLKSGDIIIKFGPKKISNIYDFMYAISNYKPGDKVDVTILRDEKELTFEVVLIEK